MIVMEGILMPKRFNFLIFLWAVGTLVISAQGGELLMSAGYGEQVGSQSGQDNAVVDLIYNFYTKDFGKLEFSLGAGGSFLWTDKDNKEHVFLVTILPLIRYYFGNSEKYRPFVFLGAGPSYMSNNDLGEQESDGRFTFNDFVGAGLRFGEDQQWTASICYRHISNASIYDQNDGIDVPTCLLVSRKF
jgi:lipid A 3-O-deacylase